MRTNAGNIKKGDYIIHQNEIWQVQKAEFSFQGRGMAVVRIKAKSVSSGKNVDLTQKSVDSLELADVETIQMQYLYNDGQELHFMNEKTYNQVYVSTSQVGDLAKLLKPGEMYYVIMYGDKALNIRPPASVRLKVIEENIFSEFAEIRILFVIQIIFIEKFCEHLFSFATCYACRGTNYSMPDFRLGAVRAGSKIKSVCFRIE